MSELGRAQSISIEKLEGAITKAAHSHRKLIGDKVIPGWYRDPGILGLILRDLDWASLDIKAVDNAASDLAKATGLTGKAASVIIDHNIIIGVIPFENFTTFGR